MSEHKFNHPPRTFKVVRSAASDTDMKFAAISQPISALPSKVDLRPSCPPVYDQGDLGSCTGNAIAAAVEFDMMKQGETAIAPSRLFIYYNERVMEGDVGQDNGAQIRDGITSIATNGVCDEALWPYDPSQFTVKPSDAAYSNAQAHKATKYYTLGIDLAEIKQALAQGYPIVFGMQVFPSMQSEHVAETGVVPMPGPYEQSEGGHCVLIVGYSDDTSKLIVRNSWGDGWGNEGYFYLPYDYVTPNLLTDLWVVTAVL